MKRTVEEHTERFDEWTSTDDTIVDPLPDEPFYDPAVDDLATAGVLPIAFTATGFIETTVQCVHDQVEAIVGECGRIIYVDTMSGDR